MPSPGRLPARSRRDVAAGVERTAAGLGFRIVLSSRFDAEADDFCEIVQAICDVALDVLLIVGRFQNDLNLAELLARSAPAIGTVAVIAAGVDTFRERLGSLADSFVGPSQWEPDAGYVVDYGPDVAEVQDLCGGPGILSLTIRWHSPTLSAWLYSVA